MTNSAIKSAETLINPYIPDDGPDFDLSQLVPHKGYIIVKPLPPRTKIGSIELPENSRARAHSWGEVVSAGPDTDYSVGDAVYQASDSGHVIVCKGVAYHVIMTDSLHGVGDVLAKVPAGQWKKDVDIPDRQP